MSWKSRSLITPWLKFARHCPFSFAYLAARIFLNGQIGKQQGCLDTSWNIVSSSQISWKTWMPHLSLLILSLSAIQAFLYWYVKNRISQLELLLMLSQHHYFIIILWHYFALLDVSWVNKASPMMASLSLLNQPFWKYWILTIPILQLYKYIFFLNFEDDYLTNSVFDGDWEHEYNICFLSPHQL